MSIYFSTQFQVFSKCPVGLAHYTPFNKAFEKCYALTGRAPGLSSCVAAEMGFVSFHPILMNHLYLFLVISIKNLKKHFIICAF
jgi:hypothetical protein